MRELISVVVAGTIGFLGGICLILGLLLLWVCGLASGLCLIVAIFAGAMYAITGRPHDGQIALAYLGYAAIPFVLTFIVGYYRSKLHQAAISRARRNTLAS